jgi:hypothetical protein
LNGQPQDSLSTESEKSSDAEKIKELEEKILTLIQDQKLNEAERRQEIAELSAKLEKLKAESKKETNQQSNTDANEESSLGTAPSTNDNPTFKYMLDGGRAVITEISPKEDTITIPSTIDGYSVYAIGSEALSSKIVTEVVISEGIEKLDWFAFRNCISLSSVTIPDSVTSIGYGAFDNAHKGFTINCSKNSFAHMYAQSYGLTYDIT